LIVDFLLPQQTHKDRLQKCWGVEDYPMLYLASENESEKKRSGVIELVPL